VQSEEKTKLAGKSVDNSSGEYAAFTTALRKILHVSHEEMMLRLAAEKQAKASKPRPSVSRASRAKD